MSLSTRTSKTDAPARRNALRCSRPAGVMATRTTRPSFGVGLPIGQPQPLELADKGRHRWLRHSLTDGQVPQTAGAGPFDGRQRRQRRQAQVTRALADAEGAQREQDLSDGLLLLHRSYTKYSHIYIVKSMDSSGSDDVEPESDRGRVANDGKAFT